jgi:nucleoside-diphosphate-sugar epimerase
MGGENSSMLKSKRILLTGATGFLGSHFLHGYLRNGHHVTILKRSFSNTRRIDDCIDRVKCFDIDIVPLERAFERSGPLDCVVHTATNYGRQEEVASEVFETNLAFPLRLLQTATFFDTPTFFNTTTVLYKYLNYYALSKKQFEDWGRILAEQGKIQFVNIKLEHVFGPGDDPSKFTTFILENLAKNVPRVELTPGEQERDFVYIDDVVTAYDVFLGTVDGQAGFQEFNLGSGHATTIRHFVETAKRIINSKTELLFGAKPYREHEVMRSEANIEELHKLGWKPRYSIEQGIARTIRRKGREA